MALITLVIGPSALLLYTRGPCPLGPPSCALTAASTLTPPLTYSCDHARVHCSGEQWLTPVMGIQQCLGSWSTCSCHSMVSVSITVTVIDSMVIIVRVLVSAGATGRSTAQQGLQGPAGPAVGAQRLIRGLCPPDPPL